MSNDMQTTNPYDNDGSNGFDMQAFECIEALEKFKFDLMATAAALLKYKSEHVDAERIVDDAYHGQSATITEWDESFKARLIKACVLCGEAQKSLRTYDFGSAFDLFYQAVEYNTQIRVNLVPREAIENELISMVEQVAKVLPTAVEVTKKRFKSKFSSDNAKKRHTDDNDGTQAATDKAHQEWLRWQKDIVSYRNQTAFIDYARQNFKKLDGKTMISESHIKRKVKIWREQLTE